MDFSLLTAITQSDLPALQRLILVMLLNHADKHGKAWPSHATLARETGMAERSVWEHMQHLEKAGWLIRTGQMNRVGVFVVSHPASSAPSIPQEVRDHAAAPAGHSAAPAATSRRSCGQTTQEPPINHPKEEEGRPPPDVVKGSTSPPKEASSPPPKPGWREWHKTQADEANAVAPPPDLPREFLEAWGRYRDYRTQRATAARVSSEAVAWTAHAASAALRSCQRHAQAHGWAAVAAQIDTAIGGNWQGLNFPGGVARRAGASAPAAFRSAGGRCRTYQAASATEGYTDEEILNFMPPHLSRPVIKK